MANLGSCYIKSCCVMTLQSVNSGIYVWACVCMCVCVVVCVCGCVCVHKCDWKARQHTCWAWTSSVSGPHIPFRRAPVRNRSIWSLKNKKNKRVLPSFVLQFYRRPIYPQHSKNELLLPRLTHSTLPPVCLRRLIRDGFGSVHHPTYEDRHPGRQTEWVEPSSLSWDDLNF